MSAPKKISYDLVAFESMDQLEAIAHVPKSIQQAAKKSGCKAFLSAGRIDLYLLLEFLFNSGDQEKIDWHQHGKKFTALSLEAKYLKEIGRLKDEGEVKSQAAEAASFYFGELDRLLREYPPLLEGQTGEKILEELERFVVLTRDNSRKNFDAIGENK